MAEYAGSRTNRTSRTRETKVRISERERARIERKVKLLERRGNVALYGLIALIFVFIGKTQELHPLLSMLQLGKVTMLLTLVLFFVAPPVPGAPSTLRLPVFPFLLGLFVLAMFSIPGSYWQGQSLNYTFKTLLKLLLFAFLLIRVSTTFRDLRRLALAFVWAVAILAVSNIVEAGGGRSSVGMTYDPNDIAMVFATALGLGWFLRRIVARKTRLLLNAALLVIFGGMMFTASRGGFLAFACAGLFCLFSDRKIRFPVKIMLLVGVAVAFFTLAPDTYINRLQTLTTIERDYNMTSRDGRIEVWKRGLEMIMENPFFGVGVAAFEVAEGETHDYGKWSSPHNFLVQIGAENGIGGIILMLGMLWTAYRFLWRRKRLRKGQKEYDEMQWLCLALLGAFLAFFVASLFLSQAYSSILYYLVAMTASVRRVDAINEWREAMKEKIAQ